MMIVTATTLRASHAAGKPSRALSGPSPMLATTFGRPMRGVYHGGTEARRNAE